MNLVLIDDEVVFTIALLDATVAVSFGVYFCFQKVVSHWLSAYKLVVGNQNWSP